MRRAFRPVPGTGYQVSGTGLSGTWNLVPGTGASPTPRPEHRAPKTEPSHRKTRTPGMLSSRHPRAGPFSRPSTFRHRLHHDGERPTLVTSSLRHSVPLMCTPLSVTRHSVTPAGPVKGAHRGPGFWGTPGGSSDVESPPAGGRPVGKGPGLAGEGPAFSPLRRSSEPPDCRP